MKYIIVYFTDVGEIEASYGTAISVYEELTPHATLLPLNIHNWKNKITKFPKERIFFMASHGNIGEDGTVAKWMEEKGYLHTHSSSSVCSLLIDKHRTKLLYGKLGIPTPNWSFGDFNNLQLNGKLKVFKKKINGGSKEDISCITISDIHSNELSDFIFEQSVGSDLEVGVTVLRNSNEFVALIPIIRKRVVGKIGIYTEYNKEIPDNLLKQCMSYAICIAKELDCYGVIKTDFVIDKDNNIWGLETDAQPGLVRNNASVKAAEATGISYNDLLRIICTNIWQKS